MVVASMQGLSKIFRAPI